MGICVSYLTIICLVMVMIWAENMGENGRFWQFEFFPIAALLYLSCPLLVLLTSHIFTRPGVTSGSLLLVGLAFTLAGHIYIAEHTHGVTRSSTTTVQFPESERFSLRADVTCEYTPQKNYFFFRSSDFGNCNNAQFRFIRRAPDLKVAWNAYWTIDGIEEFYSAGSWSGTEDLSNGEYFSGIPSAKIAKAEKVHLKWGDVELDLQEPQFTQFRSMIANYYLLTQ